MTKTVRMITIFCFAFFAAISLCSANVYYIDGVLSSTDATQSAGTDRKSLTSYNENFDLFQDHSNGYQLLVPKNSIADISLAGLKNVFTTPEATVEIFYDDLTYKTAGFDEFINYSNKFLHRGGLHTITAQYSSTVGGHGAHTTKWQRGKLSRIEGDKNYYSATSIKRTSQKIYTIVVKTSTPSTLADTISQSFSFLPQSGPVRNYKINKPSQIQMNDLTKQVYEELFSPDSSLTWGIFENSAPQNFIRLEQIENSLEHKFKVLLRYQTIDEVLPARQLERAWENNRIVELTLATIHNTQANALWVGGVPPNSRVAYDILDGKYDEYFINYAKDLKEFGKPILFRLNNEMNGDWCWYSAFYTARDAQIYVKLWHYIKAIFDSQGVDNLIWVWNPHDVSLPDFSWNNFLAYYPGDEYVDVIGLTGYNNGTYFAGEKWRTFNQIYKDVYTDYMELFQKPFMLTEFSSSTFGGNKAAWIEDMFVQLPAYPNIKVAVWWNGVDYDKNDNPGRIYLIDDSPEVVAAMKNGLANYEEKVRIIQKQDNPAAGPILRRDRAVTPQP